MTTIDCTLVDGITIGEVKNKLCVIRAATTGDLKRAARTASQVVLAPTGMYGAQGEIFEPAILINPYLMEICTLQAQVERIGDIVGPIDDLYWDKITENDIALIKAHAELIAKAALAPSEVVHRGRTNAHRTDGGGDNQSTIGAQ